MWHHGRTARGRMSWRPRVSSRCDTYAARSWNHPAILSDGHVMQGRTTPHMTVSFCPRPPHDLIAPLTSVILSIGQGPGSTAAAAPPSPRPPRTALEIAPPLVCVLEDRPRSPPHIRPGPHSGPGTCSRMSSTPRVSVSPRNASVRRHAREPHPADQARFDSQWPGCSCNALPPAHCRTAVLRVIARVAPHSSSTKTRPSGSTPAIPL